MSLRRISAEMKAAGQRQRARPTVQPQLNQEHDRVQNSAL